MPKNIDDIIAPSGRKSIRSIPIPENRRHLNVNNTPTKIKDDSSDFDAPIPRPRSSYNNGSTGYSKKFIWIGGFIAVLVVAFAVFSLFSGATITYTPKTEALTFNNDLYTAYKTGDKVLLFSVIKLSEDKGVKTPASGEQDTSIKSTGTIIVYNNASKIDQKLVKNTRFQTTDGKIYRISEDLVVPGQKIVSGSTVPGSVEANVTADQPGATYNIGLSDFTIPGFKGDPRYATIYARSKTPMTGGFVGKIKIVSDTDLSAANTTLQTSLKSELMTQAKAQVPADFIIFPNLVYIAYSNLPQTLPTNSGVTVNEHADLYGVMFKKVDLANYLATKKLADLNSNPVDVPDLDGLNLSFVGQSARDLLKADQLNFQIAGNATAIFVTDEESLKKDLAGQNKSDLDSILNKSYPSILTANTVVRPFWKSVIPTDTTKIKIIENLTK